MLSHARKTKTFSFSQVWRRNWERITPFFAFPAEIREVVYTTNALESLDMSLRKIIKTCGSFPNEEAALRLLHLALRNHSEKIDVCAGLAGGAEPLSDPLAGTDAGTGEELKQLAQELTSRKQI